MIALPAKRLPAGLTLLIESYHRGISLMLPASNVIHSANIQIF